MKDFDYILKFGRYKGKTLAEILQINYSYVLWLNTEGILDLTSEVIHTAMEYDIADSKQEYYDLYG